MIKQRNLIKIIENFKNKKILVIGDIMLDHYIYGSVDRINPEAPVPVVLVEDEYHQVGGAGNVAINIATLGGDVTLYSFIGQDNPGRLIKEMLSQKNIDFKFGLASSTISKSRVIGKSQQLLQQLVRFDKEDVTDQYFSGDQKIGLVRDANDADLIIVSDYLKGSINRDLMLVLRPFLEKVIIDPKPKNKEIYKGAFLIKPNEKEAKEMAGCLDPKLAGDMLKEDLLSNILVTLGEKGMILCSDSCMDFPASAREVFDGQGAGDTVIATLALSIAAGGTLEEATILSNHAAGIAVERKGTYAVKYNELRNSILEEKEKLISIEGLQQIVHKAKENNQKIVWTNGCFDIIHTGHIKVLKEAKSAGDILIVGIDSDDSIRKLKGDLRPINTEEERAEVLSSLKYVDYITLFEFGSVKDILDTLKPDIYVKGGDYTIDSINQEERKVVESYGGKIILVPPEIGKSTTNTINKIIGKL